MAPWAEEQMTARQRQYFDTMRQKLEQETGRTLAEWAALAGACPHSAPRQRLAWLQETHGLTGNRAHMVLGAAFADQEASPAEAFVALWKDPVLRAMVEAICTQVGALDGVIISQRKGYTAFSRTIQFGAVRPAPGASKGMIRLGLGLPADVSPLLTPRGRSETLQDRLLSVIDLAPAPALSPEIMALVDKARSLA